MKKNRLVYATLIVLAFTCPAQAADGDDEPHGGTIYECGQHDVDKQLGNFQDAEQIRLLTTKGTPFHTKLPAGTEDVEVNEVARQTRISEDLKVFRNIVKILSGKLSKDGTLLQKNPNKCFVYKQRYDRSVLTITPRGEKEQKLGSVSYILGEKERLWMSVDLPLSGNVKQITLDQNNNVVTKEKPASFYVALNAKVGDVFENDYKWGWVDPDRLSGKVLIQASTKPTNSMGAGFAYDLDYFTVFWARVWTKGEPGADGTISTTTSDIRGISFDISKGLDWLAK